MEKASDQTFLLVLSLVALIMVFFAGIFLIRATINRRKKDYSVLLLLGASRQAIHWMNLRDILWHTTMALLGTVVVANISMYYKIPYVKSAVRYYEIPDYLIYMGITIIMTVMLYGRLKTSVKKLKTDM